MTVHKIIAALFVLSSGLSAFGAMPTGDLANPERAQPGTVGVMTGTTSGDTTDGTDAKPMSAKPKKSSKMKAKKGSATKKSDDTTKTGSESSNPDPSSMDSGMNKNQ